jgi:hypothetical protein
MYRKVGQPVLIPGDMGRASWVLAGMQGSMDKTFGTTCHGAGRAMSRTAALKHAAGRRIDKELEDRGVIARSQSKKGLAEEQPAAYKNVDDVDAAYWRHKRMNPELRLEGSMARLDVSGQVEKGLAAGLTDLRLGAKQSRQFRFDGNSVVGVTSPIQVNAAKSRTRQYG